MKIHLDDIQDYLEQFHSYGEYAMACCVFHDDGSPSMLLTSRGYNCKSCGAYGSLDRLYSHVSGRPIQIRKKEYNPSAYIWDRWLDQYGSINSICDVAYAQIQDKKEIGSYLYKRNLTQSQIELGHIGYLSGYYLFPIHDEKGKIQGAVARASPTTQTKNNRYSDSKNCPIKIYVPNWKAVQGAEEIYVCFGILDAWSLLMAGYPAITGISGQEFRAEYLDSFRKPIYIIADKHEQRSALQLQSQLGWRGKRLDLEWPDGTKDPNGIHVTHGIGVLQEKIEHAKEKYNYAPQ